MLWATTQVHIDTMHQVQHCIFSPSFVLFESYFVLLACHTCLTHTFLPSEYLVIQAPFCIWLIRKDAENWHVQTPYLWSLVSQRTAVVGATFTASHQVMWLCFITHHKHVNAMFLYHRCATFFYLLFHYKTIISCTQDSIQRWTLASYFTYWKKIFIRVQHKGHS